jgi:hypothetical protein
VLALFLIWIFFVAGADAGTVVLGSMSSGVLEPSRLINLTWGAIMAALQRRDSSGRSTGSWTRAADCSRSTSMQSPSSTPLRSGPWCT